MEQLWVKGAYGNTEVHVGLEFHKIIDYDRKALRKALVRGASEIRKEARRLVSRRAISASMEFPGTNTGDLKRAIGVVSKGRMGGWIKVGVRKTAKMSAFYPAFLFYGTKGLGKIERLAPGQGRGKSNRRAQGDRAAIVADRKASNGYIVAPRANYLASALDSKRDQVRATIRESLKNSLVPR